MTRTTTNGWGIMHMMHTFTGVRISDPRQQRDWLITKLWSFSMDAIVIGLLSLVLSSLYMGCRLKKKWAYQAISFALGILFFGFFVWG